MFLMLRFLHFDSVNTTLNRGNTNPNKEEDLFSDTRDKMALIDSGGHFKPITLLLKYTAA